MQTHYKEDLKMTRAEYKENLKEELYLMDKDELKAYAKKNGVRLYTTVPDKMVQVIADTMTSREFHGDAFRSKPMDDGKPIGAMSHQELRQQNNVTIQGGIYVGLPNHVDGIEMFMKGGLRNNG